MGFELYAVVSSPVSPPTRRAVLDSAFARWPHCRGPRNPDSYPDRAIFAPPELTSYLHDTTEDWDRAFGQVCEVRAGLAEWSRAFPDVAFAFIEANCFGGDCVYDGFCCRGGEVTLGAVSARERGPGLRELAAAIGLQLRDTLFFEPFVRGYFAGRGSGGAE